MEKEKKDKYEGLPHREGIILDINEGIFGDAGPISIVFEGAIEQTFKMYKATDRVYAKIDEEKRIITGPAMRANYRILQQDMFTGEYYTISYNENQVQNFMKKFSKNGYNQISNLQHSAIAGNGTWAYSFEMWQVADVENKMDKAFALGFQDINVGDMYVSYFIEDKEMWDFIKKSGFAAFSIEAWVYEKLAMQNINTQKETIENEIKEIVFSNKYTDSYKEELIRAKLGIADKK